MVEAVTAHASKLAVFASETGEPRQFCWPGCRQADGQERSIEKKAFRPTAFLKASALTGYIPTDGISADFGDWRFNLRRSNTEPLLRLNMETRADPDLLKQRTAEISSLITAS